MTPQKLLAYYEKGYLTDQEVMNRFIELAMEQAPDTFAAFLADVPAEWLAELCERASVIPRPDELISIRPYCGLEPPDFEAIRAKEQEGKERYIAGLRAWKAYFDATDRPT